MSINHEDDGLISGSQTGNVKSTFTQCTGILVAHIALLLQYIYFIA